MVGLFSSILQRVLNAVVIVFFTVIILGVGVALGARLFGLQLEPYILESARLLSGGRLIDFGEAFGPSPTSNLRVCEVKRLDTDGDGFREWLVYYQYDKVGVDNWRRPCPDNSPRAAAIYDNDRGEPAILMPYDLHPPDRDYLGEWGVRVERHEIVANFSENTTADIPELLFYGNGVTNQLTIFKHRQNTASWTSPTNEVPRYVVIGAFRGTGGIEYDPISKNVSVFERGPFERSQLGVRNVYALGDDGTYMTAVGAATLKPPIVSTIDFGPIPLAIEETPYPEKIVLGFYQALAGQKDWDPTLFLAENSEAALKYNEKDLAYFGFTGQGNPSELAVVQLQYYPGVEAMASAATLEGPDPRLSRVELTASARQGGAQVSTGPISCQMVQVARLWKIDRCAR